MHLLHNLAVTWGPPCPKKAVASPQDCNSAQCCRTYLTSDRYGDEYTRFQASWYCYQLHVYIYIVFLRGGLGGGNLCKPIYRPEVIAAIAAILNSRVKLEKLRDIGQTLAERYREQKAFIEVFNDYPARYSINVVVDKLVEDGDSSGDDLALDELSPLKYLTALSTKVEMLRFTHQSHDIGQFHDSSTNIVVFADTPTYRPIH